MADTYDVTMPLGRKTCESSAQVTAFIGEYMQEPGASLSMVEVARRLRVEPDTGAGDLCPTGQLLAGSAEPLTAGADGY
jgi:hypothetical protein